MVLQKLWVSQNLIVLTFGGCVHLAVSIFLQKCLGVSFFVRLQSLAVPTCLSVFYIYINDKNISCLHLKYTLMSCSHNLKSQSVWGSRRKMLAALAAPSHRVSIFHLLPLIYCHPFASFSFYTLSCLCFNMLS